MLLKEIIITVEYLPKVLNQEADFQSRSKKDSSESKLRPHIFQAPSNIRGTPDMDLFASRVSHQLLCYSSWKLDAFSKGERCISKVMKIPKGVCFSTFQPNWKRVEESSDGSGPDLAKSVLVSTLSSDVSRQTDFDSLSRGSFNEPKNGKAFINREREIKTSVLYNFREKLFAEGISKNTTELIPNGKRQGSITHYKSTWRKWDSYCSREQVGPISGTLNSEIDFLADLFHSGLEWSPTAGYRSSISAFHDPIEGFSAGKHLPVCSLLKEIFNKRAPIPRYTFIWDVQKVLTYARTVKR